jgi:hypothetical protein
VRRRPKEQPSASTPDELLGEASWLLSHAEALADYGRQKREQNWRARHSVKSRWRVCLTRLGACRKPACTVSIRRYVRSRSGNMPAQLHSYVRRCRCHCQRTTGTRWNSLDCYAATNPSSEVCSCGASAAWELSYELDFRGNARLRGAHTCGGAGFGHLRIDLSWCSGVDQCPFPGVHRHCRGKTGLQSKLHERGA